MCQKDVGDAARDYAFHAGFKLLGGGKSGAGVIKYHCESTDCPYELHFVKEKPCASRPKTACRVRLSNKVKCLPQHGNFCMSRTSPSIRQIAYSSSMAGSVAGSSSVSMKHMLNNSLLNDGHMLQSRQSSLYAGRKMAIDDLWYNGIQSGYQGVPALISAYKQQNDCAHGVVHVDNESGFHRAFISNPCGIDNMDNHLPVHSIDAAHSKCLDYPGVCLILVERRGDASNVLLCFAMIPGETMAHIECFFECCVTAGISI